MEASALPASVGLARPRLAFGASLLRIRSDDQLVSLFRAGNEDAFRVIHDRYRARLHAYTRQMLAGSPHDCEDALQEVFVRAYFGLRTNRRDLALRPWLYRVAHNRCVDELRRPPVALIEPDENLPGDTLDPADRVEQREALRRLISDVQRLPDQQRSALLMRELSGMSYQEVADALGASVPAVKSLLVRARVGLAQATEARDTSCTRIREELILAHDRKVRASGLARRHLAECDECRAFRAEMRGVSRQLAALTPTLGPIGVIANLLGFGGGGATLGGSTAAAGGAGAAASAGLFATGHVVTLLAAAVVTAGGAVELQKTIIAPPGHHVRHHVARAARDIDSLNAPNPSPQTVAATSVSPTQSASPAMIAAAAMSAAHSAPSGHAPAHIPLTQLLDPDHLAFVHSSIGSGSSTSATGVSSGGATTTSGPPVSSPSPVPILPPTGTSLPLPLTGTDVPTADANGGGTTGTGTAATGTTSSGAAVPVIGTPVVSGSVSTSSGSTGASTSGTGSSSTATNTGTAGAQASTGTAAAAGSDGTASSSASSTGSTAVTGTNTPVRTRTLGRTGSTVARTVAAGGATGGHVVSFLITRRHAPSHGFTLGTLLPR